MRFGYAIAAGIAFRLAFAAYDIPQNALMALGNPEICVHISDGRTRSFSEKAGRRSRTAEPYQYDAFELNMSYMASFAR